MTRTNSTIGRRTNFATAAIRLGIVGAVASLLWGGWVLWHLSDDFGAMTRTAIPGEVTVDVAESGEKVVYYERDTLVATPVDPGIEVSVSGPDGSSVAAEATTRLQYRVGQTVRQPHVAFSASEPGSYTVVADGRPTDDGARIAVGSRIGLASINSLSGPIVVLLASVLIFIWGGAMRWSRRASGDPLASG